MGTQSRLPTPLPGTAATSQTLQERAAISRKILQCSTSPQQALGEAERLIGQWPHARPPDPKTYSAAIAATLAGYPLGIVQECCDPRKGLARTREFPPTIAAVIEWCDRRLEHHKAVAAYKGNQRSARVEVPMTEAQQASFTKSLWDLLGKMKQALAPLPKTPASHLRAPDPVLSMTVSPSLEEIVRSKGWAK